ncbi:MAG: HAD family hydrolase [Chloroflexota bacterium]
MDHSRTEHTDPIKVVSFDVEGTLVTPDFSTGMWYECIPEYYGKKKGLCLEDAREAVVREYDRVGDGRLEWYDVRYWFQRFELGDYREAFNRCLPRIRLYPEAEAVLSAVGQHYRLVVLSSSVREFLQHLLAGIRGRFDTVISTVSDYGELKTPQVYLRVCRELGISPEEMAHVGDNRQYDFLNAQVAGVRAFHLDRQGRYDGRETMKSLEELRELLLGPSLP